MHTSTITTAKLTPWTLDQLEQATHGYWYKDQRPNSATINRIITDSRYAEQGDAFLALKGERFDAHDFIEQIFEKGCRIAIVERPLPCDIAQFIVPNTRSALGHLGAYRRAQYPNLKLIALTGSSGKTTTKEMLGSILSRLGETLVTRGNLNNDLGVPITLLELEPKHQYAVVELGANHQGEINYTSHLAQPDAAGILNIGTAHLGEFGGRKNICKAKSEIYANIKETGTSVFPADDDFSDLIEAEIITRKKLSFGQKGDVSAHNITLHAQFSEFELQTPKGLAGVRLPFAGKHNIDNALAATAFALALEIPLSDIVVGLEQAKNIKGRLNFINHKNHLFIDDTYNANPASMRAAAQVLTQQAGIKIMVMGDIGELGDASTQEHFSLGRDLVTYDLDHIVTVGKFAQSVLQGAAHDPNADKVKAFETQKEALIFLLQSIQTYQSQPISFLFKGSRSTHMEILMADLMEKL